MIPVCYDDWLAGRPAFKRHLILCDCCQGTGSVLRLRHVWIDGKPKAKILPVDCDTCYGAGEVVDGD